MISIVKYRSSKRTWGFCKCLHRESWRKPRTSSFWRNLRSYEFPFANFYLDPRKRTKKRTNERTNEWSWWERAQLVGLVSFATLLNVGRTFLEASFRASRRQGTPQFRTTLHRCRENKRERERERKSKRERERKKKEREGREGEWKKKRGKERKRIKGNRWKVWNESFCHNLHIGRESKLSKIHALWWRL